jgi:hypothetical protein
MLRVGLRARPRSAAVDSAARPAGDARWTLATCSVRRRPHSAEDCDGPSAVVARGGCCAMLRRAGVPGLIRLVREIGQPPFPPDAHLLPSQPALTAACSAHGSVPTIHYIIDGGQASDSRCPSRKQRPLPTGGRSLRQALGSHSFGRPWAKILRAAGALQPPGDRRRPTSSPRSLLLASHALVSAGPDSPGSHTPPPPTHSLSPRRSPRPSLSA